MIQPDGSNQFASDAWLDALEDATSCLRERTHDSSLLDKCLFYLFRLEAFLNKPSRNWDRPPRDAPPLAWHDLDHGLVADWNSAESDNQSDDEDDDYEEAGDRPVGWDSHYSSNLPSDKMDSRRLFIRVLTSQSEVYAAKATLLRQQGTPQWRQGAEMYSFSLSKIHQAL